MRKSKTGDTIGQKFGKLFVVDVAGFNKHRKALVLCKCDCGNETVVIEARVRNGLTTSCGCGVGVSARERNFKDMTGQKIARLEFIKEVSVENKSGAYWECLCDCGNITVVSGTLVRSGHTTSCGCFKQEQILAAVTKHGKSESPIYFLWNTMMARCYNENSDAYPKYGARGITVCERWQTFENFYEDMGDKPEGKTLERKNVNEGYYPENCMWADASRQAFNTRKKKSNTSGRTGVHLTNTGWRSRIWKNRVCYDLGVFSTFEEACKAREKAEIELYGFIKE